MRGIWPILAVGAVACQTNYSPCDLPGEVAALPPAGTSLSRLYPALLSEVKDLKPPPEPPSKGKRQIFQRAESQFCCTLQASAAVISVNQETGIDGSNCLKLSGFNAPFCYDRFTTQFVFVDGSAGNLDQGTLNLVNGPRIDLIHGNYDGGNIYGTNAPPNTATLPMPTPYTASGVGSAIPLTDLGGLATAITTIPGTTITGTTQPGSSYTSVVVKDGATETVSGDVPGTTLPGFTVAPKTVTLTATGHPGSTSSAVAAVGSYGIDIGSKIVWLLFTALFA